MVFPIKGENNLRQSKCSLLVMLYLTSIFSFNINKTWSHNNSFQTLPLVSMDLNTKTTWLQAMWSILRFQGKICEIQWLNLSINSSQTAHFHHSWIVDNNHCLLANVTCRNKILPMLKCFANMLLSLILYMAFRLFTEAGIGREKSTISLLTISLMYHLCIYSFFQQIHTEYLKSVRKCAGR